MAERYDLAVIGAGIERSFKQNPRIALLRGSAHFLGPQRLTIVLLNTAERTIAPLLGCICVHPTLSEGVKAALVNLKPIEAVSTATGDIRS